MFNLAQDSGKSWLTVDTVNSEDGLLLVQQRLKKPTKPVGLKVHKSNEHRMIPFENTVELEDDE